MADLRTLYHIARADFLERTRSYGFLVTIVLTSLFAYFFVPFANAPYGVVVVDGYRGIYNSAWVGSTVAMSTLSLLTLVGFALVKNAIDRDRMTRVGQILAAAPIRKSVYLFGKFVSNYVVLTIIVLIACIVSIGMQLVRAENGNVQVAELLLPFVIVVLPAMAVVAAAAVLFESIRVLSGSLGIVVYFLIWSQIAMIDSNTFQIGSVKVSSFLGLEVFRESIEESYTQRFPLVEQVRMEDGIVNLEEPAKTFVWNGVDWTLDIIVGRAAWLVFALVIIVLATVAFRGFDKGMAKQSFSIMALFRRKKSGGSKEQVWEESHGLSASSLTKVKLRFSFVNMLRYELWLILKGQQWWWYGVALSINAANLFLIPFDAVRSMTGPLAWVWPVLIWSSMGVREIRNNTRDIIFSCMSPLERQIPVSWTAGFMITLATGSGFGLRLLFEGDGGSFLGWLVGAMFIPTLALALGVWSRSSKTFEVVFLVIMFFGAMNKLQALDFLGSMESSMDRGLPLIYFAVTVILLVLVVIGRRNQLQR